MGVEFRQAFDFGLDEGQCVAEGGFRLVSPPLAMAGEIGAGQRLEVGRRLISKILGIKPETLVEIKLGGRVVQVIPVEKGGDFFDGQFGAIVFGRPSEQAEEVAHGFG